MKRTNKVIIGWLLACGALIFALLMLELCYNLFGWSPPEFDLSAFVLGLCFAVPLIAIWFLARVTHDRISLIVAIITCLVLVALGIISVLPEPTTEGDALFTRHFASPLWYRGGKLFLMCLPGVFCLWGRRRHSTQHTLNRTDDPPVGRVL